MRKINSECESHLSNVSKQNFEGLGLGVNPPRKYEQKKICADKKIISKKIKEDDNNTKK